VDASEGEQALDYAGTTVYANALAHVVSHVNPPKKIAVFAPWGSGRTCLINALNGKKSFKYKVHYFHRKIC